MNLNALPAFADNYIWMLHDGSRAVVVDPGDAAPVEKALDDFGLALAGILVTHHHADHVGGGGAVRRRLNGPVAAVEPANADCEEFESRCRALRASGQPTSPSSIAVELRVNPFQRCGEPAVVAAAQAEGAAGTDEVSVLAALREWKNRFR
jgi:glyoxylase-like metal-dependent hydrolase (beta-lactamase superfamily II)